MATKMKDEYHLGHWTKYATDYDTNTGNMTKLGADRLVLLADTLLPFTTPHSYALDSGTGTGALTVCLAQRFPALHILATDVAAGMLAVVDGLELPNVKTQIVDASKEGELQPETFSHVLSTFMIQFLPHPQKVLEELCKTVRPGGVLGLGIWDGNMDPVHAWRKACHAVDPCYVMPKMHDASAWYSTGELEVALEEAGLEGVKSEIVTVRHLHESTESFVSFWMDGQNPAVLSLIHDWKGDRGKVRRELERVVREDYGDGKKLYIDFAVAAGRKPAE